MQIHPVGAELSHTDGRTDGQIDRQVEITKLIVAFCNFVKTPKLFRYVIAVTAVAVGTIHYVEIIR
jgi:hypothetical protein